jgi:hypothetical protein
MKMTSFWDIALMMKAVCTSEMSVSTTLHGTISHKTFIFISMPIYFLIYLKIQLVAYGVIEVSFFALLFPVCLCNSTAMSRYHIYHRFSQYFISTLSKPIPDVISPKSVHYSIHKYVRCVKAVPLHAMEALGGEEV